MFVKKGLNLFTIAIESVGITSLFEKGRERFIRFTC